MCRIKVRFAFAFAFKMRFASNNNVRKKVGTKVNCQKLKGMETFHHRRHDQVTIWPASGPILVCFVFLSVD